MESPLNDIIVPQIPETSPQVQSSGIESSEQRISELSVALSVVKQNFLKHRGQLRLSIAVWAVVCIAIIITCICLSINLLDDTFPDKWSWQIGYITAIRITIAASLFSLASFCFKLFKSYIHLNEHNSHSITVIDSMANLVGAAKDEQQRNIIYGKLIDIIIHFENSGFQLGDQDFKGIGSINLDTIKSLIPKAS